VVAVVVVQAWACGAKPSAAVVLSPDAGIEAKKTAHASSVRTTDVCIGPLPRMIA
jgi:hypothetical protein